MLIIVRGKNIRHSLLGHGCEKYRSKRLGRKEDVEKNSKKKIIQTLVTCRLTKPLITSRCAIKLGITVHLDAIFLLIEN